MPGMSHACSIAVTGTMLCARVSVGVAVLTSESDRIARTRQVDVHICLDRYLECVSVKDMTVTF